ncbi:MAG: hypothetical protein MUP70_14055 [Candidatus Aminicenantes bacterium]|nr:hypothetical protein [Candidatus Aminicenantes bacterium]
MTKDKGSKKSEIGDWVFAFFHLFLLAGILIYAVYTLIIGNSLRFSLIFGGLALYYFLVLHKNVKKEIKRRKNRGKSQ